jgi:D-glycero-D-manno-heptose 1,7-bisphosphate phosphatase
MGIFTEIKAVFLDRDGVLNKAIVRDGKPYPPGSLSDLVIIDGVKKGLEQLKNLKYLLIVITNQPDVARGITPQKTVEEINDYLMENLGIDDIFCCFHDTKDNCECRKPKTGLIDLATTKWDIDLKKSFLVGDRWKDIEAGRRAGLKTILIDYNYNEERCQPDFSCHSFKDVVQIIKTNS